MKFFFRSLGIAMIATGLAGCDMGPKSSRGFRLPDGDIAQGKTAFLDLKCHTCHDVRGAELPAADSPAQTIFTLGGEVTRIRTYGELVTSVINPSHGLAPGFKEEQLQGNKLSPMPQFNEIMTVQQMIDLVAFLQSHYTQLEPEYPAP